jgi:tetratricopeptide (TPR) repeat protein
MTAKNSLELKGTISAFPVAETLLEITQAALTGSLRIEHEEKKAIVYFLDGKAIYAVSNQRIHRLSERLLEGGVIDREFIARHRQITNDLQFAEAVAAANLISPDEIALAVRELCEQVIKENLNLTDGEWTFSPNARLKDGLAYEIDLDGMLFVHGRTVAPTIAETRLANQNECFSLRHLPTDISLTPYEAFLVSRFDSGHLTTSQLLTVASLPPSETLTAIYVLWMGGVLTRTGWKAAFSENWIQALKGTTFELKKVKPLPATNRVHPVEPAPKVEPVEDELPDQGEFDLEETLKRFETAWNHYQILGIEPNVKMGTIRKAYFRLAKMLHPDRYRNESPELARRIEKAFTELSTAHETLKTPDGRQSYDIKMRELERDRQAISAGGEVLSKQEGSAAAEFERGFAFQLNGDFEAAVPHLARAVHYSPNNARYHAYYGKALSADDSQRLKAQNELLAAIQLEPANPTFRLLLAEFFVRYKLLKRAEGELTRLLETSPDNREAITLLDSIRAKSLN